jgi:hypothetical protein
MKHVFESSLVIDAFSCLLILLEKEKATAPEVMRLIVKFTTISGDSLKVNKRLNESILLIKHEIEEDDLGFTEIRQLIDFGFEEIAFALQSSEGVVAKFYELADIESPPIVRSVEDLLNEEIINYD